MSSFPLQLNPSREMPRQTQRNAWIPAVLGIVFVACTSNTLMGGTTSQIVVDAIWRLLFGTLHKTDALTLNIVLRKVGHFLGHGAISLLFCRAWYASLRRAMPDRRMAALAFAAGLAVLTSLSIASLDEWHQAFTPGRVGCVRDVLIDTAGALTFNLIHLWRTLRVSSRQNALRARHNSIDAFSRRATMAAASIAQPQSRFSRAA
jgi:VanZ family protein